MSKISERDQFTIVLEDLRSKFDTFGDGLQRLTQKVDQGFSEIRESISTLKTDALVIRSDIRVLKSDVAEIKIILRSHDEKFDDHEDRITAVENS